MPSVQGFVTPHQCASEAAVAPMTIYRLCYSGAIPYYRIGRSVRIRRQDWLNYLAAQRKEGSNA